MNFPHPDIHRYLMTVTPERDPIQKEMEEIAKKNNFPIIGPLVGRFLCQMALLTKAKKILELGSGYGYSASWFAKGMPKGGTIICTEGSEENARMARDFWKRGKVKVKLDFRVGDALSVIDKVKGQFDIILCDIDKWQYPEAFKKAVPRLRKGGLFITDNLLWSGKVIEPNPDADTRGIIEFTKLIYNAKNLLATLLPIRDGISVCVKL